MVPNFARDASTAWLNGWEAHVNAPFARLKQKTAGAGFAGLPGFNPRGLLLPPGAAPIRFKPRLKKPLAAPGLAPSLGRTGGHRRMPVRANPGAAARLVAGTGVLPGAHE